MLDNVYMLNYLINRQIGMKGRKMVAVFVDLKAAFDSMDRLKLIDALRERGVKKRFIARMGEILRETWSRMRVGRESGEGFWAA